MYTRHLIEGNHKDDNRLKCVSDHMKLCDHCFNLTYLAFIMWTLFKEKYISISHSVSDSSFENTSVYVRASFKNDMSKYLNCLWKYFTIYLSSLFRLSHSEPLVTVYHQQYICRHSQIETVMEDASSYHKHDNRLITLSHFMSH